MATSKLQLWQREAARTAIREVFSGIKYIGITFQFEANCPDMNLFLRLQ